MHMEAHTQALVAIHMRAHVLPVPTVTVIWTILRKYDHVAIYSVGMIWRELRS